MVSPTFLRGFILKKSPIQKKKKNPDSFCCQSKREGGKPQYLFKIQGGGKKIPFLKPYNEWENNMFFCLLKFRGVHFWDLHFNIWKRGEKPLRGIRFDFRASFYSLYLHVFFFKSFFLKFSILHLFLWPPTSGENLCRVGGPHLSFLGVSPQTDMVPVFWRVFFCKIKIFFRKTKAKIHILFAGFF